MSGACSVRFPYDYLKRVRITRGLIYKRLVVLFLLLDEILDGKNLMFEFV